jgi:5-oxopent-3-ene-1,2,5-tricarboxylate decarboxylase / 2-hydroxyhepta-2,4-diene-1,7-dioate isomerase
VSSGIRTCSLPEPGRNTVYGAALNYRSTLAALGSALNGKPYVAPPEAPVLYIKPANTWIGDGDPIPIPADVAAVQAGVTLAALVGRDLYRATPTTALSFLAGFTVVNDVTVPHTDYFRPVIQNRCRDGFCAIGSTLVPADQIAGLDDLRMRVWVNGALACSESLRDLVRPVARLLADISALFTLAAGDLVLVGAAPGSPLVRAGDRVALEIDAVGRLENPVIDADRELAA